jgi:hypothetical protein
MDIICASCGRHFKNIETVRDHAGHCSQGDVGFYALSSDLPNLTSGTEKHDNQPDVELSQSQSKAGPIVPGNSVIRCPLKKTDDFPCPRCGYSQSHIERIKYLNSICIWYCKYPQIVNWKMLSVADVLGMPIVEDK